MVRWFHLMMKFFVLLSFWIGMAAGVKDDDSDEIEMLKIAEGQNLSIPVHISKSEEDPQVLVTRLEGSSQERVAQMICHEGDCTHECWRPGVSLASDGPNVTLTLMNLRHNQTGLYKIHKLSSVHSENRIYNVTLFQPPFTTISPEQPASTMYSKSYTPLISSGAAVLGLVVTVAVIGLVYSKLRKVAFKQVLQEINTVV